jgi:NAD+--asparagine ADP-ribosyltransferase
MKITRKHINLAEVAELLTYNNGALYWKKSGKKAGTTRKEGYNVVQLHKTQYYAHRLIWAILKGEIPQDMHIDHINRNKSDNRIENLRLVTTRENALNKVSKPSNTGIYGVSKDRDYYKVSFTVDGKSIHIGNFKDIHKAKECAESYVRNKRNVVTDCY